MKTRITLEDSILTALTKMSDGNPGAAIALTHMVKEGPKVDVDAGPLAEISGVMYLDTLGIYGTDIYILWNDLCNRNTSKVIALLRAVQLGFLDGKVLADACHRQDRSGVGMIDVEGMCEKVTERLPNFKLEV